MGCAGEVSNVRSEILGTKLNRKRLVRCYNRRRRCQETLIIVASFGSSEGVSQEANVWGRKGIAAPQLG